MKKILVCITIILCTVLCIQCQKEGSVEGIIIPDTPYQRLSEYNFFEGDLAALSPAPGVLPYDLNSPLFSDYAHKARFVWMPPGSSATYTTEHVLEFPKEAVLIKNFFYQNDETDLSKGRRIMETRILINRGEEWDAIGYIWNEEQTEAEFEVIGAIKDVAWIDQHAQEMKIDYIIPNKNQCKGCHAYDGRQKPIGPKVRNLNKDYDYADGTMNQLDKWASVGYLSGYTPSAEVPAVAVWDDSIHYTVHQRSMAYLDINCGHCHNPKGAANTSGLTLLADSEMGLPLGVYKATVSAGAGTGGHTYSIVPGNADESIMVYRMNSDNPGAMMPELGRRLIHTEGVNLITQWIDEMEVDKTLIPSNASLN